MLSYWDILVMSRTKKSIEILQTVLYASYLMNCCHCYNFISSINVNIWQSQCNIVFADPVIWIRVWAVRLNWNYRKWQAGCTTLSRRGLWVPKGKMFHNHLIIGPADFNQFFSRKKSTGSLMRDAFLHLLHLINGDHCQIHSLFLLYWCYLMFF